MSNISLHHLYKLLKIYKVKIKILREKKELHKSILRNLHKEFKESCAEIQNCSEINSVHIFCHDRLISDIRKIRRKLDFFQRKLEIRDNRRKDLRDILLWAIDDDHNHNEESDVSDDVEVCNVNQNLDSDDSEYDLDDVELSTEVESDEEVDDEGNPFPPNTFFTPSTEL